MIEHWLFSVFYDFDDFNSIFMLGVKCLINVEWIEHIFDSIRLWEIEMLFHVANTMPKHLY